MRTHTSIIVSEHEGGVMSTTMQILDTVKRADYHYVTVDDKPGEGARVLEALKAAGVNLIGFHAFPAGVGKAQLDFVAQDASKLVSGAARAGVKLSQKKPVFLIEGQDRPGAIAEILAKLAAAKVNVTALDAVTSGNSRFGALLWVKPTDVEKAATALAAR
ncbi:MAG: ACT domain-containing protein [Longimicrobiales bacterium]